MPVVSVDTPENIRKPVWMFSGGVLKETSDMKWVNSK